MFNDSLILLTALRNSVNRTLSFKTSHGFLWDNFDPQLVEDLFTQYEKILRQLTSLSPSFFNDIPVRNFAPMDTVDFGGRGVYPRSSLMVLLSDIDRCIDILSQLNTRKETEDKPRSRNIFIVHGRDQKPVDELKLILLELRLNPIVLHEQASGSLTIAEKLEKYSDVGYAFVILTPDDVGCLREDYVKIYKLCIDNDENNSLKERNLEFFFREIPKKLINRARQNVVLEFGYFIGKLGREKVCCLHKGDIEIPSDMQGIVYVPFKESVNEQRIKIMRELINAGYEIKI